MKQLRVRPRGRISGGNFVSKPAKKILRNHATVAIAEKWTAKAQVGQQSRFA